MPGAVAVAHFPPTSQREAAAAAAAAVQSSMSMILSNLAAGNFLEPFFWPHCTVAHISLSS